jgi:hypothetical protein
MSRYRCGLCRKIVEWHGVDVPEFREPCPNKKRMATMRKVEEKPKKERKA